MTRFEAVRLIRDRADAYDARFKRLQPRQGAIGVGSAWIDPFVHSEALNAFLRALGRGADPEAAGVVAQVEARLCIKKHNDNPGCATFTGKHEVQRWEGMADPVIDWAVRLVGEAAEPDSDGPCTAAGGGV